jgi:hypothetical protein
MKNKFFRHKLFLSFKYLLLYDHRLIILAGESSNNVSSTYDKPFHHKESKSILIFNCPTIHNQSKTYLVGTFFLKQMQNFVKRLTFFQQIVWIIFNHNSDDH